MRRPMRSSRPFLRGEAKFIVATDSQTLQAEELTSGETITPDFPDFRNHFGFPLPLAGISTIKEIKDNPIDVRATARVQRGCGAGRAIRQTRPGAATWWPPIFRRLSPARRRAGCVCWGGRGRS
jgi:hypothetical protein